LPLGNSYFFVTYLKENLTCGNYGNGIQLESKLEQLCIVSLQIHGIETYLLSK
jgi:hypothetical protein